MRNYTGGKWRLISGTKKTVTPISRRKKQAKENKTVEIK
jgi:hypothetical protein